MPWRLWPRHVTIAIAFSGRRPPGDSIKRSRWKDVRFRQVVRRLTRSRPASTKQQKLRFLSEFLPIGGIFLTTFFPLYLSSHAPLLFPMSEATRSRLSQPARYRSPDRLRSGRRAPEEFICHHAKCGNRPRRRSASLSRCARRLPGGRASKLGPVSSGPFLKGETCQPGRYCHSRYTILPGA